MATATDVRNWAQENDLPAGGTRGRLPQETVDAFNKGRKDKYVPGAVAQQRYTVKVPDRNGRIRPRTFKAAPSEIRTVLRAKGVQVPDKGRLTQEQIAQYATLR